MNKLRLILAGLLLLGFTACSNDDDDDKIGFEAGNAVQFESTIIEMSQARTIDDNWTSGDEIGIYMVKSGTTLVMGDARNKKYTADVSGKLAAAGDSIYYPADANGSGDFSG